MEPASGLAAGNIISQQHHKFFLKRNSFPFGWEFLFLGDNIDAAREAARFGIDVDRAANYHADTLGTEVVYEAVSETVCNFRASMPMAANWKQKIDEDFRKRSR